MMLVDQHDGARHETGNHDDRNVDEVPRREIDSRIPFFEIGTSREGIRETAA